MSCRVHRAALALASDGTVLVNVAHFARDRDPHRLLELALSEEGVLFIGVVASGSAHKLACAKMEDAACAAVGILMGIRQRRRRETARRRRRTAS